MTHLGQLDIVRICTLCLCICAFALTLTGCATNDSAPNEAESSSTEAQNAASIYSEEVGISGQGDGEKGTSSAYRPTREASQGGKSASTSAQTEPCFPIGWLALPVSDIPAGTPVRILTLPDIDIRAHVEGDDASASVQDEFLARFPQPNKGRALVEYAGSAYEIDTDALLVNLPDIMPQAEYDIVYAYAATSKCGDRDIPDVTGFPIPGYREGKQFSSYWNARRYAVPCAYATALKATAACNTLAANDLRLVVFDAYRPTTAQYYLSDALVRACEQNPELIDELGWDIGWYVAPGPSGHNYGTDLDVGVCNTDGSAIELPSAFDSFSESGHLTAWPLAPNDITPEAFRDAVRDNDACMILHEAFSQAGFGELASEWWHFSDEETESTLRGIVGDEGLDFVATFK